MKKLYFIHFKELSEEERLQLAGFDTALFDDLQVKFLVKEIRNGLGTFSSVLFDMGWVRVSIRLSSISITQWKFPNNPVRQILEVRTLNRRFRLNGLVRS